MFLMADESAREQDPEQDEGQGKDDGPNQNSSRIGKLSWGSIFVGDTRYKDCKVWPGGSKKWDWSETGTSHNPGVQPADIEDILSQNVKTLVISQGMEGVLQVPEETKKYVQDQGVQVIVRLTKEAVKEYNELVTKGIRVGGIFHSTC